MNSICNAYTIPLSTKEDIDSFNTKLDKEALKQLLEVLNVSNDLPVPLVGNGTGCVKVRSISGKENRHKVKLRNIKILSNWKRENDITTKVVTIGDGSIRGTGLESVSERKLFNQGDVAEGVFATMLFMKFADKPMTEKSLNRILYKLKLNKEIESTNSMGDIVKLSVNMSPRNFAELTSPVLESQRNDMFLCAKEYTHSKEIKKYEKYFKSKGELEEIKVVADGLGRQKDSKIDIYIDVKKIINGSSVVKRTNLSLKYGKAKQFGQVSGSKFANFQTLWETFGLDISFIESKYDRLIKKGKAPDAIKLSYSTALDLFNEGIQSKSKHMNSVTKVFQAAIYHATLGEDLQMIQLKDGVFKTFNFNQTKSKLNTLSKKHEITADIRMSNPRKGGVSLPTIVLNLDTKPFLHIRAKSDMHDDNSFYCRNYVEKLEQFELIFN